MSSIARRLLQTETEWNPKVMLGRVLQAALPSFALRFLKKHWSYYMISRRPEDWMEADAAMCAQFIGPDDVVLDIGASLGSFSHFFSKRAGKVYSFEPIPQTFEFLSHNMKKIGLANVECVNVALSDRNDSQCMVIPTYRWGQDCWYDAQIETAKSNQKWRRFIIHSRTLDSMHLPSVSFIKCDVNGHELEVLKGARSTIERCHPAMMIEVDFDMEKHPLGIETLELLRTEGYEPYLFYGKELRQRRAGERGHNYFFLRPEHIKKAAIDSRPREEALLIMIIHLISSANESGSAVTI